VADAEVTLSGGRAANGMPRCVWPSVSPGDHRVAIGADRAYDMREVVESFRATSVTHVAQGRETRDRASAIDARTARHPGYAVSPVLRKRVEEIFGWTQTVGSLHKPRHRRGPRVGWMFTSTAAAYDLVRIRNLAEASV
jgi:hypothetical protein